MKMIRQCTLMRGRWTTVAWVPEDEAEAGNEVEIVMSRVAGEGEDGRPLLRHSREQWRVVETWGVIPDPHHAGEHDQPGPT